MSKEDLIPLKPKGDPYSDAIRAKIKGSASEKRKIAQKINSIPLMNPDNVEKAAWELISNENLSAAHIERLILEMLKKDLKPELRAKLIDSAIKAHQAIHGSKNKNLNVNVDLTSDKIIERLRNWKKNKTIVIEENGE